MKKFKNAVAIINHLAKKGIPFKTMRAKGIQPDGRIRAKFIKDCHKDCACPIIALLKTEDDYPNKDLLDNNEIFIHHKAIGTNQIYPLMEAADDPNPLEKIEVKLRKLMIEKLVKPYYKRKK